MRRLSDEHTGGLIAAAWLIAIFGLSGWAYSCTKKSDERRERREAREQRATDSTRTARAAARNAFVVSERLDTLWYDSLAALPSSAWRTYFSHERSILLPSPYVVDLDGKPGDYMARVESGDVLLMLRVDSIRLGSHLLLGARIDSVTVRHEDSGHVEDEPVAPLRILYGSVIYPPLP